MGRKQRDYDNAINLMAAIMNLAHHRTVVAHILPLRQRDFQAPRLRPHRAPRLRVLVSRSDLRQAALLDQGITYGALRGLHAAVDFLCEQHIALPTIARVLFRAGQRRAISL